MAQDALERLYNASNSDDFNYTVEEQMASVKDDDFFESMSEDSRSALMKSISSNIQEVTLDEKSNENSQNDSSQLEKDTTVYSAMPVDNNTTNNDTVNSSNEELFNNNKIEDKKVHRQRRQSKISESDTVPVVQTSTIFDPIMDQLSLNLLNELQSKRIKINNFDDNLMQIIFDYMRTKF